VPGWHPSDSCSRYPILPLSAKNCIYTQLDSHVIILVKSTSLYGTYGVEWCRIRAPTATGNARNRVRPSVSRLTARMSRYLSILTAVRNWVISCVNTCLTWRKCVWNASVPDVCLQALIQPRTKKIIIAMIPACCLLTAFTLINLRRVVKVQSSLP